jgi:hypothetical protein
MNSRGSIDPRGSSTKNGMLEQCILSTNCQYFIKMKKALTCDAHVRENSTRFQVNNIALLRSCEN